jgi:2-polyprenyl-3-methyl-5-hydroxy-6-metoxy-1,4-benzoquinol methylase
MERETKMPSIGVPKKQMWDEQWRKRTDLEVVKRVIANDVDFIIWRRIFRIVRDYFGRDEGLTSIEFGGGLGLWSLMLAKYKKFSPTLLDFSEIGLDKSRQAFTMLGLGADYMLQDVLAPAIAYPRRYDVSLSNGFAEHFPRAQRRKVFAEHHRCLGDRGVAIIAVPNSVGIPWQLYRHANLLMGKSAYLRRAFSMARENIEIPFSRAELLRLATDVGFRVTAILGTLFFQDLYYYVYHNFKRLVFRLFLGRTIPGLVGNPRVKLKNITSPFDNSLGAYLYLVALK